MRISSWMKPNFLLMECNCLNRRLISSLNRPLQTILDAALLEMLVLLYDRTTTMTEQLPCISITMDILSMTVQLLLEINYCFIMTS